MVNLFHKIFKKVFHSTNSRIEHLNNILAIYQNKDKRMSLTSVADYNQVFNSEIGQTTTIYVNSDGSKDFIDIQSALNSITDASRTNRYIVKVQSDYYYSDPLELYMSGYGVQKKNKSHKVTKGEVGAFHPKAYVTIEGDGEMHTIKVDMPSTVNKSAVVVCHPYGEYTIKNLHLIIHNGRYVIHQDNSGSAFLDANQIATEENLIIEHLGNEGSDWLSVTAQGDGLSSGQIKRFRNCTFISPIVPISMHGNSNFKQPSKVLFEGCTGIISKPLNIDHPAQGYNYDGIYITHYGNGRPHDVTFIGCNFPSISYKTDANPKTVLTDNAHDIRNISTYLHGYGNKLSVIQAYCPLTLVFVTKGTNISIEGGTAYSAIIGDELYSVKAYNSNGIFAGTEVIGNNIAGLSLATRLGNCANINKTLNLTLGSKKVSIIFDANYSLMSNNEIIEIINNKLNGYATVSIGYPKNLIVFDDMCIIDNNVSDTTISVGDVISYDFTNCGIKIATENEKIIGIAAEYIEPNKSGRIVIKNNIVFQVGREYYQSTYYTGGLKSVNVGSFYKVSGNGKLEEQASKDVHSQFVGIAKDLIRGL